MLSRLLELRSSYVFIVFQRSLIVKSDFELSREMKKFNDIKQFQKTIELFQKHKQIKDVAQCSSFVISDLLKACTHLNNIELGSKIHSQIESRVNHDPYILLSLINLYSKLRIYLISACKFFLK